MQKDKYYMIPFILRIGKCIKTESRLVVPRVWQEQGVGSDCYRVQSVFRSGKNILELEVRAVHFVNRLKIAELYILKG